MTEELHRQDLDVCLLCRRGLCRDGSPVFYRVEVAQYALDQGAIRRTHGLELMMGGGAEGAVLASVLGPGEALAKRITAACGLVCTKCACEKQQPVAILMEQAGERNDGD